MNNNDQNSFPDGRCTILSMKASPRFVRTGSHYVPGMGDPLYAPRPTFVVAHGDMQQLILPPPPDYQISKLDSFL